MENEVDEREIVIKREDYVRYIKESEELRTLKRCLLRSMKLDYYGQPSVDADKVIRLIETFFPDDFDGIAESLKVKKQAEEK